MQHSSESAASQLPSDGRARDVLEPRRPVFYTAAETSKIVRLDESTLYRHLRNGTFPGVKIGGRYVVPQAVLERLISDVLATGRCVDLADWTEQNAAAQRFCLNGEPSASRSDRGTRSDTEVVA
jgi:hypothetical protein